MRKHLFVYNTGADPGGGAHRARAPLNLKKKWFFWRKIVIFHTKYPQKKNLSAPPNLKSWIHPCNMAIK
jgi:hypothetical protein